MVCRRFTSTSKQQNVLCGKHSPAQLSSVYTACRLVFSCTFFVCFSLLYVCFNCVFKACICRRILCVWYVLCRCLHGVIKHDDDDSVVSGCDRATRLTSRVCRSMTLRRSLVCMIMPTLRSLRTRLTRCLLRCYFCSPRPARPVDDHARRYTMYFTA